MLNKPGKLKILVILIWTAIASLCILLLLVVNPVLSGRLNQLIYRPVDMGDYWMTIPAGMVQMGGGYGDADERPVHAVFLDGYWIGRHEVTNRQYNQCLRAGVCVGEVETEDLVHPVVDVTWFDARTFCEWVGGRLPTEAEWENAARGGLEGRDYPWGDETPTCTPGAANGANYNGEGCPYAVMPVMSFAPNGYGLFDTVGNVLEWVSDWYSETYYARSPFTNPTGPQLGEARVLRGGAWYDDDYVIRSAFRFRSDPSDRNNDVIGFRCARGTSP